MKNYISVKDQLPRNGVIVDTLISDENGIRNKTELKRQNNLWFLPT